MDESKRWLVIEDSTGPQPEGGCGRTHVHSAHSDELGAKDAAAKLARGGRALHVACVVAKVEVGVVTTQFAPPAPLTR